MRRLLWALIFAFAAPAWAETPPATPDRGPAVLIADAVRVEGGQTLVADGSVEVLYGTSRLRARRITYDRATGALSIEGPITLTEGAHVLLLADAAQLDADLRNGILTSARLVLDEQLQVAAAQVRRVDGRYTEMRRTVASSCQVCAKHPVPLWSIRAERITHDEVERQLYFENATFRVMDVPLLWLPKMRLPDPTVTRVRGFLVPSIRSTSQLGTGVKIPYFIPFGDSRDLTVTPYLSAETRTLELRYRQAFTSGEIEINGAVSRDTLYRGNTRSYVFGSGTFRLPQDFKLSFDIRTSSDRAYLLDYDYSDDDRLKSYIRLERVRRDERIAVQVIHYRTLRDSEIPVDDRLPYLIGQAEYVRRLPGVLGGEGRLTYALTGYGRSSNEDILGRDAAQLGVTAGWQRTWITRPGIEVLFESELALARYYIGQDSSYANSIDRATPSAGVTLRWPFERSGARARQLVEPIAQIAWSDTWGDDVPNEDSMLVEFDQGNLLALDRYPGYDRTETGWRAALGVNWQRYDPTGWSMGLTLGRVYRIDAGEFTEASGLSGEASDWLVAAQLQFDSGILLSTRAQFDDSFSVTKSETQFGWAGPKLDMTAGYVWVVPSVLEGRDYTTSQVVMSSTFDLTDHWRGAGRVRYDIEAGRAASAAVGFGYRNECLAVDLSLSRRFTSSTSVQPTTDIGLKVSLNGFGNDGRAYRGTCAR